MPLDGAVKSGDAVKEVGLFRFFRSLPAWLELKCVGSTPLG